MTSWPFHEAETRLSELPDRAGSEGPQVIVRDGREDGAVISMEALQELQRLRDEARPAVKNDRPMTAPTVKDLEELGIGMFLSWSIGLSPAADAAPADETTPADG